MDGLEPQYAQDPKTMLAGLPNVFIENRGQLDDPDVHFYAVGASLSAHFGPATVTYGHREGNDGNWEYYSVDFEGANRLAPGASDPAGHLTNYFVGDDPTRWATGVRSYHELVYQGLWDDVDLRFYFRDGRLKYDFIVGPDGGPSSIRMGYRGMEDILLDPEEGDLIVQTATGCVRDSAPIAFQESRGVVLDVPCAFRLDAEATVSFEVGEYDPQVPLVIDPGLKFSSFFGALMQTTEMTLDSFGSIYITGLTGYGLLPTTPNAFCSTGSGGYIDAFIAKFDSDASSLLYCTYVGGDGLEVALDVALDGSGGIWITGLTTSSNWPLTSDAIDKDQEGEYDGFVTGISTTGTSLLYSTYLGGGAMDLFSSIEVSSGAIYVGGASDSSDYPTTPGALQRSKNAKVDMVLSKFSVSSHNLLYSTFIGGNDDDILTDLEVDRQGNAYGSGFTNSSNFPVSSGAYCRTYKGKGDAIVFKLNIGGTVLDYCTFFGGAGEDGCYLTLDSTMRPWIWGITESTDIPTTSGAFRRTQRGGANDTFFAVLSSDGSSLEYSTYFGWEGDAEQMELALDADENPVILITTSGKMLCPTTALNATPNGGRDIYLAWLDIDNRRILNATYLGGTDDDMFDGDLEVTDQNVIIVTGETESDDFPTTPGAYNTTYYYGPSFITGLTMGVAPWDPPSAPMRVVAQPGDHHINVTWDAPADVGIWGIEGYRVYVGTSPGCQTLDGEEPTPGTYKIHGLKNGQTYYVSMSTVSIAGESPKSSPVLATPFGGPLAPMNLTVTPGCTSVQLSWEPPLDDGGRPILEYKVFRGETMGSLDMIATLANVTGYSDINVTPGTRYYYGVRAFNIFLGGPMSEVRSAVPYGPPGKPLNVMAMVAAGQVTISWDPPASDGGVSLVGYRLYKGPTSGSLEHFKDLNLTTYFVDFDVVNGETYHYAVLAFNPGGDGPLSDVVDATPRGPPDAPRDLAAEVDDGTVTLTWTPPENDGGFQIIGYKVYRGDTRDTIAVLNRIGVQTTFKDVGLDNGMTYYYQVLAINDYGDGDLSEILPATPLGGPHAPRNLLVEEGDESISLSWQAPGETGGRPITAYKVYRGSDQTSLTLLAELGNDAREYQDTGLVNGQTYWYAVAAVNEVGDGLMSEAVSGSPFSIPGPPKGVVATPAEGEVNLSWEPPDEDGGRPHIGFTIYRGTAADDLRRVADTGNDTYYLDEGLDEGATYFYAVSLTTEAGEGPMTEAVEVTTLITPRPPGPPRSLELSGKGGKVILIWVPPSDNGTSPLTGYVVLRGQIPERMDVIATLGEDITSYTDRDVKGGETYFYTVAAKNAVGRGTAVDATDVQVEKKKDDGPAFGALLVIAALVAISLLMMRLPIRRRFQRV